MRGSEKALSPLFPPLSLDAPSLCSSSRPQHPHRRSAPPIHSPPSPPRRPVRAGAGRSCSASRVSSYLARRRTLGHSPETPITAQSSLAVVRRGPRRAVPAPIDPAGETETPGSHPFTPTTQAAPAPPPAVALHLGVPFCSSMFSAAASARKPRHTAHRNPSPYPRHDLSLSADPRARLSTGERCASLPQYHPNVETSPKRRWKTEAVPCGGDIPRMGYSAWPERIWEGSGGRWWVGRGVPGWDLQGELRTFEETLLAASSKPPPSRSYSAHPTTPRVPTGTRVPYPPAPAAGTRAPPGFSRQTRVCPRAAA